MNKERQLQIIEDLCPAVTQHNSKRRVRHLFFENILTELQAYLLGFYTADGSIDEKRKTLRIELQKEDSEIVYLFKDTISLDARLYTTEEREFLGPKGKLIHAHGNIGVDITSAQLCTSLVNLGIGYRKSWKELKLPNIKSELIKHFIRGYFDGDGCISGYIRSQSGRLDLFTYYFLIDAKTSSLLLDIQKWFASNNIKVNINYIARDDMYRLKTSSKQEIKKIYKLLFKDCNYYLSRKFNKISHYVNTEVTLLITEYRNALKVSVNESNNPSKSPGPLL